MTYTHPPIDLLRSIRLCTNYKAGDYISKDDAEAIVSKINAHPTPDRNRLTEKYRIAENALIRIKEDAEYCYGKPYDYTARLGDIAKKAIEAMGSVGGAPASLTAVEPPLDGGVGPEPARCEISVVQAIQDHVYHEAQDSEWDAGFNEAKRQAVAVAARHNKPVDKPFAYTGSGSITSVEMGGEGHMWAEPAAAHPVPVYLHPPKPVSAEPLIKRLQSVRLFLLDKRNAAECESANADDYGYQIAMIECVLGAAGAKYVD